MLGMGWGGVGRGTYVSPLGCLRPPRALGATLLSDACIPSQMCCVGSIDEIVKGKTGRVHTPLICIYTGYSYNWRLALEPPVIPIISKYRTPANQRYAERDTRYPPACCCNVTQFHFVRPDVNRNTSLNLSMDDTILRRVSAFPLLVYRLTSNSGSPLACSQEKTAACHRA